MIGGRARLDLAVHALAQLPDQVTLEASPDASDRQRFELLAAAYGVSNRIELRAGAARAVFASPSGTTAVRFAGDERPSPTPLAEVAADGSPPEPVSTMAELLAALPRVTRGDSPIARQQDDARLAGQLVVIVTNRPTHYRVPLFNRLSRRLAAVGGSLRILFTDDLSAKPWMRPEAIEYEHTALDTRLSVLGAPAVPIDLGRRLRQLRPTILLAGGLSPTVAGAVAHFAHRRGIPFGVWSGELATRATAQSPLRRRQRQWLLRRSTYGVAYGYRSGEYLRRLRPDLPIVYGRNTTTIPSRGPRVGAPAATVEVLTVGRALPLKRLDVLIAAFARLTDVPCRLTVVGDGPSLPALREQARSLLNVRFLGAVPSDRVAEAYDAADVFLFPSRDDVFGLVLVEAMGAGLATIASSRPGAVADLVATGHSGLVLDGYDPDVWADAIRRLVEDAGLRDTLARGARDTIMSRWTLDHAEEAMAAGFRLGALASTR